MIIFDIETGPLAKEKVFQSAAEFIPPKPPGEFNPAAVKIGNVKDEVKIKIKVDRARSEHNAAVRDYAATTEAAKVQHEADIMGKAALSPLTGQILAIGYKSEKGVRLQVAAGDNLKYTEADLISDFWALYSKSCAPTRKIVGHNIFGFDLPFLIRRSWANDIQVPATVIDRDRFWNERVFVDTMKKWQCGTYGEKFIKLEALSAFFGGPVKPAGIDGGMFADLIAGNQDDQKAAVEYLLNDLEMTWKVAVSLGII